ncbi:hypothetical protein [Sphingosinicella sp. LY1275]|uniref:hypothetical protein n=1 Tax=Sphingosinicella sp. LY1275 TaxID=3095379 RepID=UPI002ADEB45C|nr:hypothetical protein [Sphingosinicella sp. LY1275]MEA1013616.1 hypothetical protein [Sphingosinicella sp. LY1275]
MGKIVSAIDTGTVVGRKSAGFACLPNGGLRWNQGVAVVDPIRLTATAADELASRHLPLSRPDRVATLFNVRTEAQLPFAVSAEITGAQFELCQPEWGLGRLTKVRGSGALKMRWHILSRATNRITISIVTDCDAKIGSKDGGFSILLDRIVRECARQFSSHDGVTRLVQAPTQPQTEQ